MPCFLTKKKKKKLAIEKKRRNFLIIGRLILRYVATAGKCFVSKIVRYCLTLLKIYFTLLQHRLYSC